MVGIDSLSASCRFAALVFPVLILSGCSTLEPAVVQYDSGADYQGLQSFTWITDRPLAFHQVDQNAIVDPVLESSLKKISGDLLAAKGFHFVNNLEDADLAVSFSVGARTRKLAPRDRFPDAISGDERDEWLGYWADSNIESVDYLEGQICIEFHDVRTRKPIWHGTVRDILLDSGEVFDESVVQTVVVKILDKFPPNR